MSEEEFWSDVRPNRRPAEEPRPSDPGFVWMGLLGPVPAQKRVKVRIPDSNPMLFQFYFEAEEVCEVDRVALFLSETGGLDLHQKSFDRIVLDRGQSMDVEWKVVDCPVKDDLTLFALLRSRVF